MQCLEVSGAVRLIYRSLGVKGLSQVSYILRQSVSELFLPVRFISRVMPIRIVTSTQLLGVQSVHEIYIQSRQPGTLFLFPV